jgi:hypothetical protein
VLTLEIARKIVATAEAEAARHHLAGVSPLSTSRLCRWRLVISERLGCDKRIEQVAFVATNHGAYAHFALRL